MQKPVVIVCAALIGVVFFASALPAQEELYEKGRRAYLKKDYRTAVKYLSDYVERNPDAGAYYLLGYAKYELLRKTGSPKGKKNFWGDTRTAEYFRDAYLIDPGVSARTVDLKKE
jgi:uncharacterized membrane protein YukC